VDLTIHEQHFIDLNPNREAATKGGSMSGVFQMQKDYPNPQNNIYWPCF